jgi:uncharacterized circularly permuted ATP-grasp superfamily protein
MTASIQEVIDTYHALLTDQIAVDAQAAMSADLRRRKCYFGERPICTVLRPHFFRPEQWRYMKHETETVLRAFGKLHKACLIDTSLRAALDLESWEEQLYTLDTGFEAPWTTARLDSFYNLETGELRFIEYNAETPAGMGYEDQLAEAFLEIEPIKQFHKQYDIRNFHMRRSLLSTLLEAYRQFGGIGKPQIGIIDWADVPTLNEHDLIRQYCEAEGYRTLMADPRALEYHDGHLWAGDFRIDLLYKRVLSTELIQRMGLDNPIVHAVRDRAVCMSNAFSAKLMAKKASFTLLSDERYAYLYDAHELAAIDAHIPWTRLVSERKTLFHQNEIDMVPFIAENRHNLVLKPNDEYGGKGVVIGWETSSEHWNEALSLALNEPYVVQERVNLPTEDFPTVIDGKLDISPRLIDADPFIFQGRTVNGCLTRLSTVALLNVTAGGGSVIPSFIVEKHAG